MDKETLEQKRRRIVRELNDAQSGKRKRIRRSSKPTETPTKTPTKKQRPAKKSKKVRDYPLIMRGTPQPLIPPDEEIKKPTPMDGYGLTMQTVIPQSDIFRSNRDKKNVWGIEIKKRHRDRESKSSSFPQFLYSSPIDTGREIDRTVSTYDTPKMHIKNPDDPDYASTLQQQHQKIEDELSAEVMADPSDVAKGLEQKVPYHPLAMNYIGSFNN